jgi:hypothetical protein
MHVRHRFKSLEKTLDLRAKSLLQRSYADPHAVAPSVPDVTEPITCATAELTSNVPAHARFLDEGGGYLHAPG